MAVEHAENWPLSNYPVLFALILLVATAVSLGLGNSESYANQLAIYAYFLLVIGVAMRFLELTLPETFVQGITEKITEKIFVNDSEDELISRKDSMLIYFSNITKNVFFFLLIFLFIVASYGILVDWSFVEAFIIKLGGVMAVFLLMHLVLRIRI